VGSPAERSAIRSSLGIAATKRGGELTVGGQSSMSEVRILNLIRWPYASQLQMRVIPKPGREISRSVSPRSLASEWWDVNLLSLYSLRTRNTHGTMPARKPAFCALSTPVLCFRCFVRPAFTINPESFRRWPDSLGWLCHEGGNTHV
jgi:hypothetical protein